MSKADKLLEKLRSKPAPTDFKWDDLVTLMKRFGFKEDCKGGSHYSFFHKETDYSVIIARSHPGGILKKYQIEAALEALEKIRVI